MSRDRRCFFVRQVFAVLLQHVRRDVEDDATRLGVMHSLLKSIFHSVCHVTTPSHPSLHTSPIPFAPTFV